MKFAFLDRLADSRIPLAHSGSDRRQRTLGLPGVLRYPEMVDSLTVEAVQRAAKKYFDTDNYVRVVLYPEDFNKEGE